MSQTVEQFTNLWRVFKNPARWHTWSLVWRARRGDLAAYDQLVSRYQSGVGAISLYMLGDVELASRACFLSLVESYANLSHLHVRMDFGRWLYRNTLRETKRILTELLRHSPEDVCKNLEYESKAVFGSAWPPLSGAAIYQQDEAFYQPSLGLVTRLDVEYREVLILREIVGLDDEAIALITGTSAGTVQFRLNHAHMKIKNFIRDESTLFSRIGEKR